MQDSGRSKFGILISYFHHQQGGDDEEEADGVYGEADALVRDGDNYAGDGWAYEACAVEHHRIHRDGIAEVFLVFHQGNDEGLARGHIEGVDKAEKDGEKNYVRDVDVACEKQDCQEQCLEHRKGLGGDEDAVAVPAVGHNACNGRDKEGRNLGCETDHPKEELRAGEAIYQPGQGDLLSPGANKGYNLAREEKAIVSVSQGTKNKLMSF